MKTYIKISRGVLLVMMSSILLCSCVQGGAEGRFSKNNKVKDVIDRQIKEEETNKEKDDTIDIEPNPIVAENEEKLSEESLEEEKNKEEANTKDIGVDVDLTQMGSDMVYATVYQMRAEPKEYEGKKVRVQGAYYAAWYEEEKKYYFGVIIKDALACCSQGMEFELKNPDSIRPGKYPLDDTEVQITGTFETYTDKSSGILYCRLKDAELEVIGN